MTVNELRDALDGLDGLDGELEVMVRTECGTLLGMPPRPAYESASEPSVQRLKPGIDGWGEDAWGPVLAGEDDAGCIKAVVIE